mgnify:CR=1 FL=1
MTEGTWNTCYKCKISMWIPASLQDAALRARGVVPFYCTYGHRQFYIEGESEADKLRRERDRLTQRLAQKDDEIARQRDLRTAAERSAAAMKGQVTKIKNRVGKGVCPCCNRTFENLQRHMHSKHPTFTAEPTNVVPIKAA